MKCFFLPIATILALMLLHSPAEAQSKEIIVVDGAKYYEHIVQRDETIHSIATLYDISRKEITKNNRIALLGLRLGQPLLIPVQGNIVLKPSSDVQFIEHTVVKDETAFGLSRKYEIEVEELYKYNPTAREGLRIGAVLRIPQTTQKTSGYFVKEDDKYYYHKVAKNQSLTSIALNYNTDIKKVRTANPNLTDTPKEGTIVKIPKPEQIKVDEAEINISDKHDDSISQDPLFDYNMGLACDTFMYAKHRTTMKVALLLPFFLDINEKMGFGVDLKAQNPFYKNSEIFIEFYEGFILALDTLRKAGLNVKLFLYDTSRDSTTIDQLLKNPEMQQLDLIIGPVYPPNIEVVARFARQNQIPMVSPLLPFTKESEKNIVSSFLAQNPDLLYDNPFLFQVNPSVSFEVEQICNHLSNFPGRRFVLVHGGYTDRDDSLRNENLAQLYKNNLFQAFADKNDSGNFEFREVFVRNSKYWIVKDSLTKDTMNIIIIPSSNEAFISGISSMLIKFKSYYDARIVGMPSWERFQNLETEYLHTLKLQYQSYTYINYERSEVAAFVDHYREVYYTEPTRLSFQGYDIGFYFGNALMKFGKNLWKCLPHSCPIPGSEGLGTGFNFKRVNNFGGSENRSIYIIEYDTQYNQFRTDIKKDQAEGNN